MNKIEAYNIIASFVRKNIASLPTDKWGEMGKAFQIIYPDHNPVVEASSKEMLESLWVNPTEKTCEVLQDSRWRHATGIRIIMGRNAYTKYLEEISPGIPVAYKGNLVVLDTSISAHRVNIYPV